MLLATQDIAGFVGGFLWPFTRIGVAFAFLPVFGAVALPLRIRVLAAFAMTLVLWPLLPPMPAADPLGADGFLLMAEQVVIGLSMGMVVQIAIGAVVFGGQTIAGSMGLGFAAMADPQHGEQIPVVSQFFSMMVTLLFLAADGHLVVLDMLARSFTSLPVGGGLPDAALFAELAGLGGMLIATGVALALPVVVATLMTTITFGVVSRTAPQLNLFSIGFPMSMVVGFVALWLTSDAILLRTAGLFENSYRTLAALLGL